VEPINTKALISLLDDPDEEIYQPIRQKLKDLGISIIPELEEAWEHSTDKLFQSRVENLIHQLQLEKTAKDLEDWARNGQSDLLKGVLIVSRYQYPDLNEENILTRIETIKRDIWLELNDHLTALEKVKVINHILFDVHGFSGNTDNYHSPQNSFFNTVLESKKGNPLSLSILYAILSQSLNIPIYGVNLPEHFVLAYVDSFDQMPAPDELSQFPILFYINAFSKGTVFARQEIDNFLTQLKIEPRPRFYEPCTNLDIIKRIMRNLIMAYDKSGYPQRKEEIEELLTMLETMK
jgi:regulator of sirC expression with transglutaminase-like and TPR domain